MRRTVALSLAISLVAAPAAYAEGSVKALIADYDRGGQSRVLVNLIAEQVALGLAWANTRLKTQERRQIYCPPADMALRGPEVIDLLRAASEDDPTVESSPYGLALMIVLEKAYPCPLDPLPKPMKPLSPPSTSSPPAGRSSSPPPARRR